MPESVEIKFVGSANWRRRKWVRWTPIAFLPSITHFARGDIDHALRPLVQIARALRGFHHFRLSPNGVELLDKFISIILGLDRCREGIERFVSHLLIFVNRPAKATGIPDVLSEIGHEYVVLCHDRIMRLGVRIASGNSATIIKIAHYVRREHTDCKGGVELQKR